MAATGLVLLLGGMLAGTLGVRVERVEGLSAEQGETLATVIAQVAEVTSSDTVKLDRGPCGAKDACARDVRARTGAEAVLFVSAYGAVSKIGLFLELHEPGKAPVEKRTDLELTERTWRPALVRALSGFVPKAAPKVVAKPAPPPPKETPPVPVERPIAERAAEPPPAPRPVAKAAPVTVPVRAETTAPSEPISPTVKVVVIGIGGAATVTGLIVLATGAARTGALESRLEERDELGGIDGIQYDDAHRENDSIFAQTLAGGAVAGVGAAIAGAGLLWLLLDEPDTVATIAPSRDGASFVLSGAF